MIDRLGWDWDNYAPDWDRAVAAARGRFSGGVNSPWDAYYSGHGLRNDDLSSIAATVARATGSARPIRPIRAPAARSRSRSAPPSTRSTALA
ncbi:hypothetical protein G6F65_022538 [Rhizopus arrhizus]|nr:hypothetical protein G6F65_022538 [Rhizopus arrhizus]